MSSKARRDCDHIRFIGERVSFTDSGCPRSELYLGNFVVQDFKCENCRNYKQRNQKVRKPKYG